MQEIDRPAAMKVQQLAPSLWPPDAAETTSPSASPSSIMLSINLIGSLTPPCKLAWPPPSASAMMPCTEIMSALDLRSKRALQKPDKKCLMETVPSGTTRWNPAPEQIQVLEALYQSGVRTPNAEQIEGITAELGRYGKIEGKNVFYWFQNHKSRERQKRKRSALLALTMSDSANTQANSSLRGLKPDGHAHGVEQLLQQEEEKGEHERKRTCRSWCVLHELGQRLQRRRIGNGGRDQTLELFPLHPERKQM